MPRSVWENSTTPDNMNTAGQRVGSTVRMQYGGGADPIRYVDYRVGPNNTYYNVMDALGFNAINNEQTSQYTPQELAGQRTNLSNQATEFNWWDPVLGQFVNESPDAGSPWSGGWTQPQYNDKGQQTLNSYYLPAREAYTPGYYDPSRVYDPSTGMWTSEQNVGNLSSQLNAIPPAPNKQVAPPDATPQWGVGGQSWQQQYQNQYNTGNQQAYTPINEYGTPTNWSNVDLQQYQQTQQTPVQKATQAVQNIPSTVSNAWNNQSNWNMANNAWNTAGNLASNAWNTASNWVSPGQSTPTQTTPAQSNYRNASDMNTSVFPGGYPQKRAQDMWNTATSPFTGAWGAAKQAAGNAWGTVKSWGGQ